MKKSSFVALVLITAGLAACNKPQAKNGWDNKKAYVRSDSTAKYARANYQGGSSNGMNMLLWYYAFRPYGTFYGGSYHPAGYYSSAIPESSNVGHSAAKAAVIRGGFGGSHGFSVSS